MQRGRKATLPHANRARRVDRANTNDIDWVSIAADVVQKLAPRWSQSDTTRADVESAVNLACALTAQKIRDGEPIDNVKGMVWTIARYTLNTESRVRAKLKQVSYDAAPENGGLSEREQPSVPSFEEPLLRDEALWSVVNTLSDDYRAPLIEHYVNGLSYQEIETITQIKSGTARNNVARAKKIVKAGMER